jgi:hypothetical protein
MALECEDLVRLYELQQWITNRIRHTSSRLGLATRISCQPDSSPEDIFACHLNRVA